MIKTHWLPIRTGLLANQILSNIVTLFEIDIKTDSDQFNSNILVTKEIEDKYIETSREIWVDCEDDFLQKEFDPKIMFCNETGRISTEQLKNCLLNYNLEKLCGLVNNYIKVIIDKVKV
jgi:hypothetical protein